MPPRAAFVNGGILGLLSYANWLRRAFPDDREIHAEHFVLTEDLTPAERVVRRALCARLWPDALGPRNLDLARYRQEMHSGLQARRRLLARGLEHFDVLHFHRQATAYAALDLMRRVPSIVSMDCTQTCVLQDARSAAERWSLGFNARRDGRIFRRAAAIVSTSRWAERDLRQMYPDCRTPIHVMPNPVPLDLFEASWLDERRARARLRPQCLFMGGDFPRKGGYDLLAAWEAGGFAQRADLTLVTEWRLGPLPAGVRQVRGVRGHTPAWIRTWREADLFVMPTRSEAFGLVYQEAAAAGLPAIGSDLNAVPEIITDGHTGLLVAPGDRAALARALDTLIGSAELRDRLGRNARRKIEEDAHPDQHRRQLVALLTRVASIRQGPDSHG
ncbi:MAG TPA: glycosyltransferase family 4 protein [Vicinamibacterales bacterium]|nr:glycosyltransferase family 4 protein [Vicinamibacterales bacterium]